MRVLIIDDDAATTEIIALMLKQMGEEVAVAHSGEEGIRIARFGNLDLIVLDMMMPGMDGLQTCQALRQFSYTPILMLSAVDNPCLVAEALNAGADDYLVKPAGVGMLAAKVRKLARRSVFQAVPMAA